MAPDGRDPANRLEQDLIELLVRLADAPSPAFGAFTHDLTARLRLALGACSLDSTALHMLARFFERMLDGRNGIRSVPDRPTERVDRPGLRSPRDGRIVVLVDAGAEQREHEVFGDLADALGRELEHFVEREALASVRLVDHDTKARALERVVEVRARALAIIDVLDRLERNKLALCLAPPIVWATDYIITTDRVAAHLWSKSCDLDAQRRYWCPLIGLDASAANTLPHSLIRLPIDTSLCDHVSAEAIIDEIADLDEAITGTLIHGDNLRAASLLLCRMASDVDCLYADPPFNTNDVGFVYRNTFDRATWLAMVGATLAQSRPLLGPKGVVALAIDDQELHHLGLLCDRLYGCDHRLGILVVEVKPSGRTRDRYLASSHEYCLLYGADPRGTEITLLELSEEQRRRYDQHDERGAHRWRDFLRTGGYATPDERPNSCYPIYWSASTGEIGLVPGNDAVAIWPFDREGRMRVWRKTRPSLLQHIARGEIRVSRRRDGTPRVEIIDRIKAGLRPKSVWIGKRYDAASHGTKLLKAMLGESRASFTFPKSLHAVCDLLRCVVGGRTDATVLDLYGGSGTTAHAVIELNRADGGLRRFVLVEAGDHYDHVLVPRVVKAAYSRSWKNGKATDHDNTTSQLLRRIRIASFSECLTNVSVEIPRVNEVCFCAFHNLALSVGTITDPDGVMHRRHERGSVVTRSVDIESTFSWWLGLRVRRIATRQCFVVDEDASGMELRPMAAGPWWFKTIEAQDADGQTVMVVWRAIPDPSRADAVLREWAVSHAANDAAIVYVNGCGERTSWPVENVELRAIEPALERAWATALHDRLCEVRDHLGAGSRTR